MPFFPMAEAFPACRAMKTSSLPSGLERLTAGWRNCRGLFPARLWMGRFQVKATRNWEIEGPSQQCSSQIPLRCLPGRNPRNTGFRPTSGRICSNHAFRVCLASSTLADGILVPCLAFFNGLPFREKKLRLCATGSASVHACSRTMENRHWQSQWHIVFDASLISIDEASSLIGAFSRANNSQDST